VWYNHRKSAAASSYLATWASEMKIDNLFIKCTNELPSVNFIYIDTTYFAQEMINKLISRTMHPITEQDIN